MKFTKLLQAVALGVMFVSCSGEDGEPGPQGPQGEQGIQGEQGVPGEKGEPGDASAELTTTPVTGTLSGIRSDGTTLINHSFEYAISKAGYDVYLQDETDPDVVNIDFVRQRGVTEDEYLSFDFKYNEATNEVIQIYEFDLSNYESVENSQTLFVRASYCCNSTDAASVAQISNYTLNKTEGTLTFDYTITVPGADVNNNNDLTVTGTANLTIRGDVITRMGK